MSKPAKKAVDSKRGSGTTDKPATKKIDAFDDSNPLAKSTPGKLAGLLKLNDSEADWNEKDLTAILRHQLAQPLEPIAEQYLPASSAALRRDKFNEIRTFGDLFAHSKPPEEILEIVRQYARDSRDAGELTLPPVISGAIYWLAIAAARATGATCHSKLSKTEIEVGLKWLGDQKWIDEPLKKLAYKAIKKM